MDLSDLYSCSGRDLSPYYHEVSALYDACFKKYDKLNESVHENVKAIRVVKTYVREDYEKKKFAAAADDVCRDFVKGEKIIAWNTPVMNFFMYI